MVDRIFGETAIGGETVGAVALVGFPIVKAGGVHALAASLALSATGVDLHADTFADLKFINAGSEGCNGAHIFMAGRKILVERQAALDVRRRAAVNDFKIGCADRDGVDADQDFGAPWNRCGFVAEKNLIRIAQDPRLHLSGNRKFRRYSDTGGVVHGADPWF